MWKLLSIVLIAAILSSCGSRSTTDPPGIESSSEISALTIDTYTTNTIATSKSEITTIVKTTTSYQDTSTTTTATTTIQKTYSRDYNEFGYTILVENIVLCGVYEAADIESDMISTFEPYTLFESVGETFEFYAVKMNGDIAFLQKRNAREHIDETMVVTTTLQMTEATRMDDLFTTTYEYVPETSSTSMVFEPIKTYRAIDTYDGSDLDKSFHRPECYLAQVGTVENASITIFNNDTYSHMIDMGFHPCKECNPD